MLALSPSKKAPSMFRLLSATLALGLIAGTAFAQNAQTNTSKAPPAVSTSKGDSKTSAAPVPGANSFTEAEARSRIEARGYTNVTSLAKDHQSIWRGNATKDGKPVGVALDYQGNVTAD
jgi:putative membrane protein